MAYETYMRIRLIHDAITGPYTFAGKEGLFKVHTYNQIIGAKETMQSFGNSNWVTHHGTVHVSMDVNNLMLQLLPTICPTQHFSQTAIRRVVLYFPELQEGGNIEIIGQRFLLEPVKLEYVRMMMPNIKDRKHDHFGHELYLGFRYKHITVTRPVGNIEAGPYLSYQFYDESDCMYSPEEIEELEVLLREGPHVAAAQESAACRGNSKVEQQSKSDAGVEDVTIFFRDEEGCPFNLTLEVSEVEKSEAKRGKAVLKRNCGKVGLSFNRNASNHQPDNTGTFA
ncbi:hypothetical protein QA601_18335 [Chitinispirillales bacterium ANBcel5]|uniref:hypothetical protein n=1 Tax=Cellulosispirillum alkaliphilum TaxID=3039283 RepID=UPI002A51219C|nr:hypothetical protein [Chitinispirillales bacterium ANBcel5]